MDLVGLGPNRDTQRLNRTKCLGLSFGLVLLSLLVITQKIQFLLVYHKNWLLNRGSRKNTSPFGSMDKLTNNGLLLRSYGSLQVTHVRRTFIH